MLASREDLSAITLSRPDVDTPRLLQGEDSFSFKLAWPLTSPSIRSFKKLTPEKFLARVVERNRFTGEDSGVEHQLRLLRWYEKALDYRIRSSLLSREHLNHMASFMGTDSLAKAVENESENGSNTEILLRLYFREPPISTFSVKSWLQHI